MANPFFQFKQFTVYHDRCAMKVTTDGCLFGSWCAHQIQKETAHQNILDIGTGTGLLSLMVAQKNDARIDSIEIDENAAQQAEENIAKSPFAKNIKVHHQDIRAWNNGTYDSIICNPPFYENELRSENKSKNLAHHSDALGLNQLLQIIFTYLEDTGAFYLLLPYKRFNEIAMLLQQQKLYINSIITVHPTTAHAPFRLMLKGSKQEKNLEEQHLYIKDADGNYSPAFYSLLKDYYLYL